MSLSITEPLPSLRNKAWWLALGLASPLWLVSSPVSAGVPLAALALLGLLLLLSQMRQQHTILYEDQGLHVLVRCFLFLWAPMLLSALGADDAGATWRAIGLYAGGAFAAVGVMAVLRAQPVYRQMSVILMAFTLILALDIVLQKIWGRDIAGYPLERSLGLPGHASGWFAEARDGGFYLGLLAAVPLYTAWMAGMNRLTHMIMLPLLAFAVAYAADCSGWIMFLVSLVPYLWVMYLRDARHPLLSAVVIYQVFGWLLFGVWLLGPDANPGHLPGVMEGARLAFAQAAGSHHELWSAAVGVAGNHPFNGVGAGGFAAAVSDHAETFRLLDSARGNSPQQVILQVLAETGVPGLIGFVLAAWAVWRLWRGAPEAQRQLASPWLGMLVALWWPLNAHQGFFAPLSIGLTFFLLAMAVSALTHKRGEII